MNKVNVATAIASTSASVASREEPPQLTVEQHQITFELGNL